MDMVWAGEHFFQAAAGTIGPGAGTSAPLVLGDPAVGPNRCAYYATPPSVVGLLSGNPAAAFADFPVTEP